MLQTPHEVAAGLRDLAQWIDAHPAHQPFITRYASTIDIYPHDKESFVALARDMAPCAKDCDPGSVNAYLRKEFRGGVRLLGVIGRQQVCRSVQVGTRTAEEPVYEWRWDPLLEEDSDA